MIFMGGAALKKEASAGVKHKNRERAVQPAFHMGL